MRKCYLVVDGMLSGTGIRDAVEGGYLEPRSLGLSCELVEAIGQWLLRYEEAHYNQFADSDNNRTLDEDGVVLARRLQEELPHSKIEYYSSALLMKIAVD